jgi:hypothetical protein
MHLASPTTWPFGRALEAAGVILAGPGVRLRKRWQGGSE